MKHDPLVGIIGCKGKVGSHLMELFNLRAHRVIGSDIDTELTNEDVVRRADIVIFAVRLGETANIVRSLVHLSRPDQLWLDMSSLKEEIVAAMLESDAQVAGLHPLFAPVADCDWRGKKVVVCPTETLKDGGTWLCNFLETLGVIKKVMEPAEHDALVAGAEQNLLHLSQLAIGEALMKGGYDPALVREYATANSAQSWDQQDRLYQNTAEVIADLLCGNAKHGVPFVDALRDALWKMRTAMMANNPGAFVAMHTEQRLYFQQTTIKTT